MKAQRPRPRWAMTHGGISRWAGGRFRTCCVLPSPRLNRRLSAYPCQCSSDERMVMNYLEQNLAVMRPRDPELALLMESDIDCSHIEVLASSQPDVLTA